MKNTVFPHKFWRPFLDCMPQLFFRPQYVWFPVHLKGHLIPLCYETLVVNWQNWLFTLFHQSRSVLSPNPIDTDRGNVHAKGQGQKSRSQRSKQILPQFGQVRTVTPVWIHIWLTNDAQSLKQPRKCALLFFKVICEISRSHKQIWEIW